MFVNRVCLAAGLLALTGCGGGSDSRNSDVAIAMVNGPAQTGTVTQQATPTPTPTASQPTPSSAASLPRYVLATYWLNETPGQVRLRDVDARYNVIYLFAARPVGGAPGTTGAISWHAPTDPDAAANLVSDIALVRGAGRRVVLSVGGYNQNVVLDTRERSKAFLDSFEAIYDRLGGIDGLDWDNYEGSDNPNVVEMTWIGQQLKALHPGFMITSPPAPWSDVDRSFCASLLKASALDYCAPQFYDGPQHADPPYIAAKMQLWTAALGPEHVVLGLGVNPGVANYMTIGQATDTWTSLRASYPTMLGVFDWKVDTDRAQGWPFAERMSPLVVR